MGTFWETLAFVTGLMLALGVPVLFVAWRAGLGTVARGFAVADRFGTLLLLKALLPWSDNYSEKYDEF